MLRSLAMILLTVGQLLMPAAAAGKPSVIVGLDGESGYVSSTDRQAIRAALERVPAYHGLIKNYAPPFTSKRHEALAESDVFLARYSALDGALEKQP